MHGHMLWRTCRWGKLPLHAQYPQLTLTHGRTRRECKVSFAAILAKVFLTGFLERQVIRNGNLWLKLDDKCR